MKGRCDWAVIIVGSDLVPPKKELFLLSVLAYEKCISRTAGRCVTFPSIHGCMDDKAVIPIGNKKREASAVRRVCGRHQCRIFRILPGNEEEYPLHRRVAWSEARCIYVAGRSSSKEEIGETQGQQKQVQGAHAPKTR